jgi:hypothetical protein
VIWASWVALIAIYVRVFYFIVFGSLFTSMASDAVEISTTVIVSVVLLLFIQYGSLEYDRMIRHIRQQKNPQEMGPLSFAETSELKKLWNLRIAGSLVGLIAVVARTLFHFFTGTLPIVLGNEVVEYVTTAIVIIIFAWFLYIGASEYGYTRRQLDTGTAPITRQ